MKATLTTTLMMLSLGLTACGERATTTAQQAPAASAPVETASVASHAVTANPVQTVTPTNESPYKIVVKDIATAPTDEKIGSQIRLGYEMLTKTGEMLPKHVGGKLNCTSCHLNGGMQAYASPWVGLPGLFPEYRARSGKIVSLQQRINGCFERSMNGKALPVDSPEMNAILAYMMWISEGVPAGHEVEGRGFVKVNQNLEPNRNHGKMIFESKCVVCHLADGAGIKKPDGGYIYPAVAGPESFNDGAGMARTYTAAAYIKGNMPFGQGNTLTDQEAIDVADYMSHMPRPVFAGKAKDYPKGDRPKDARI